MNSKRTTRFWALAAASLAAVAALGPQTNPARPSDDKTPKPLVRMDLLRPGEPRLAPERRNIFTGSLGVAGAAIPFTPDRRGKPGATNPQQDEPEEPQIDIRYVGFVISPRGLTGLILVQGSAQAVTQGQAIRPGYTVTRLSRKEVEVTGPDGVAKTYALQGVEE